MCHGPIQIEERIDLRMNIHTATIDLSTKGFTDIHDITPKVQKLVERSDFKEGTANLFVPGSTAGLTTIEYEPGLVKDIPEFLEKLTPYDADYHHHQTWGDHNGSAHLRAALIGPSIVVPFAARKLCLGTWQQIVLIDFDDRHRKRQVVCQLQGE